MNLITIIHLFEKKLNVPNFSMFSFKLNFKPWDFFFFDFFCLAWGGRKEWK